MELASATRSQVSHNLALAILFSAIPLLEATQCPLKPADVQLLTSWLNRCCEEAGRVDAAGGADKDKTRGSGATGQAVDEVLHERQVQDIRLALARGLVKAHVRVSSIPMVEL